jgi:hypothetical protein
MKVLNFKNALKLSSVLVLLAMVTFTSCGEKDPVVDPPEVILDGIYVKGDAVAYSDFNEKAMMASTKNEVGQVDRASLMELYISVKGTGGFNIVKVAGSTKTVYGPASDFAEVTNPTGDEPHSGTFYRGGIEESSATFTVPEDGFYHVVFDTDLNKVVVARVHWGLIGAATPNGWGGSTDLTESAFDATTTTWTISGMELRGGDWKLRYSNGWKIELDTTLDDGNGNIGVKVNTNFGGAIDDLVPGGANIVNSDPGVYDITLSYTLGTGYTLTATKTGGLPLTDWNGVICDAVGTGVSSDNANAIADPSSWNWGNKLLADGAPTKVGDVYTWTWTNMVIEANEGFKLRTENGVAPTTGGANFDAGLEAVDHANSSSNVDPATSGNLQVTVKGTYTIVLTIDAADNDKKVITIN